MICCCWFPTDCRGQALSNVTPRVDFYALDHGLLSRVVHASVRDRHGLLWLSTDLGLSRFDGYEFVNFLVDQHSLTGALQFDIDGQLVIESIAAPDSLTYFNPLNSESSSYRLGKLVKEPFVDLWRDYNTPTYFLAGDKIYRLSPEGKVTIVHQLAVPAGPDDRLLFVSEQDYVWVDTERRQLIENRGKINTATPLPTKAKISLAYRDLGGTNWIATGGQLFSHAPGAAKFRKRQALPSGADINTVHEDDNGRLIFGNVNSRFLTDAIIVDEAGIRKLDWLTGIEDRVISFTGTDFNRELYLNTYMGLYILHPQGSEQDIFEKFMVDDVTSGKFGNIIRGFASDRNGDTYTNKDSGSPHWFRVNSDTRVLDSVPMLDGNGNIIYQDGCGTNMLEYQGDIYGLECDRRGSVSSYIYRYRPADDSWKRWKIPDAGQVIGSIVLSSRPQEMLIVCEDSKNLTAGAVYRFDVEKERIKSVGATGSVKGDVRMSVLDTFRNKLWIAGYGGGITSWDLETNVLSQHGEDATHLFNVMDIEIVSRDKLYIGTLDHGIICFNPTTGSFKKVGELSTGRNIPAGQSGIIPLPSNSIAGMEVTREGYLLIATFNGLVLYLPKTRESYTFDTSHGLPSNEFNTPALYYHEKEDRYYAGTINGFVTFTVADLLPDSSEFETCLIGYTQLGGKDREETLHPLPCSSDEPLVFGPQVVYFKLFFTLPDFRHSDKIMYQSRLVGFDPTWKQKTSDRFVSYTRLPAGNYLFELRAFDSEGNIGQTFSIMIRVLRPWYQRTWFLLTSAMVLIAVIFFLLRRRLRTMHKDLTVQRNMARLEASVLRQQLNPHFLSNAMNAIREYVLVAKPEEAASYLTDFGRLMRLFLEASRKRFTLIDDEIEMLERYVRLEQMRFPGRFTAEFFVDPDIDTSVEEVPSLLLQPLVENAILHGFFHLPKPGKLQVSIIRHPGDEEVLVCSIADNGIGRQAAAAMQKDTSAPAHVSRATQIFRERQLLLQEESGIEIDVYVRDVYPSETNTGTLVVILINYGEGPMPLPPKLNDPFPRERTRHSSEHPAP